jgi:hypothetical protein
MHLTAERAEEQTPDNHLSALPGALAGIIWDKVQFLVGLLTVRMV